MCAVLSGDQKGGAGKSTLAAHFSVLADLPNKPALLVDADPRGSLVYWHGRRAPKTPNLVKSTGQDTAPILADAEKSGIGHVIIDSPPHNVPAISSLKRHATLTVVAVRPGPFDLAAVEATFRIATALRGPLSPSSVMRRRA